jgi:hypothetical protein
MRNAAGTSSRAVRWKPARDALWRLLDPHVRPGATVAVVGAGNGYDVPLRRLLRRAGRVDLVDLDGAALARTAARLRRPASMRIVEADVTDGAADAIVHAALAGRTLDPAALPDARPVGAGFYDVVVGDLLFSQLLYPALKDAGLTSQVTDPVLLRDGQALTDAVVARLHASAPAGVVVCVNDVLGWWARHEQPFTLDEVLDLARRSGVPAALDLVATGNRPFGSEVRPTGVLDEALWRWPFSAGTDYLVHGTVSARATGP